VPDVIDKSRIEQRVRTAVADQNSDGRGCQATGGCKEARGITNQNRALFMRIGARTHVGVQQLELVKAVEKRVLLDLDIAASSCSKSDFGKKHRKE
jgi:hypothetical protein